MPLMTPSDWLCIPTGRENHDLLGAVSNELDCQFELTDWSPQTILEHFDIPHRGVILLGDTAQTLAVAFAAHLDHKVIAHIHGGEVTYGSHDDSMRHAISKLASIHFVVSVENKARLLRMGEQPDSVYVVGSIGTQLASRVPRQMNTEHPYFLFTWHEPTWAQEDVGEVLEAFDANGKDVWITKSNAESTEAWAKIMAWANTRKGRAWILRDAGMMAYHKAMSECVAVVGNSSSGIFEAPAMGVPVVNIGSRQAGRGLRNGTPCEARRVAKALEWVCGAAGQMAARVEAAQMLKPDTLESIARILKTADVSPIKRFYDAQA